MDIRYISLIALLFIAGLIIKDTYGAKAHQDIPVETVCECIGIGFPNKALGEFSLSWYSPKELGKPAHLLRTSQGTVPKDGRTIAVDPKVIPYGSIVYIENYGYYIAEDCGGAIKGHKIDIYTNSYEYAIKQGRKKAKVWIMTVAE